MKKKSITAHHILKAGRIIILVFFTTVILSPLITITAFHLAYRGKIYPGVQMGNIPVGGLISSQAQELINQQAVQKNHLLTLKHNEQTWVLDLNQIDLRFYPETSAQKAYLFGREQTIWQNLNNQYLSYQQGKLFSLDFGWDENKMETMLASISAQINKPAVPPTLTLENGKVKIQKGKKGEEVANDALLATIAARAGQNNWQEFIKVPITTIGFLPSEEEMEETKKRAEELKEKSIVIAGKNQNFVLEQPQLIEFLSFRGGWDKDKIISWVNSIKEVVERPAKNALFEFKGDKVVQFAPSQTGLELDKKQLVNLIIRTLSALEADGQSKSLLEMPSKEIAPKITTANSNQFGITELVGKGESWFFHSISSRIHNVDLASSHFNGILIQPGEEFSFNKALGDVSQATGYKQAWIIKDGKTILGDGGGVCQVSTTLFRAVLDAGLEISERHPHAYRVSYYEYNSPLGMDATVFAPSVDLKFKNDYPCHLLIQRKIDKTKQYLSFEIYGCPDGRRVTVSNHKTWAVVPPPPPLYVDDPTLPPGKVKQIDFPAWGSKTSFDWKVTRDNQVLRQKTFYSSYRAWQAIYLKGVGN